MKKNCNFHLNKKINRTNIAYFLLKLLMNQSFFSPFVQNIQLIGNLSLNRGKCGRLYQGTLSTSSFAHQPLFQNIIVIISKKMQFLGFEYFPIIWNIVSSKEYILSYPMNSIVFESLRKQTWNQHYFANTKFLVVCRGQ